MKTSKPVTQEQLARAANLSPATVSMALADHPQIPPATRDRVRALSDQLGYRPLRRPRALPPPATALKRATLVQVEHRPRGEESLLATTLMLRRAGSLQLRLAMHLLTELDDERIAAELLRLAGEADGLVVYGEISLTVLNRLAGQQVPFVVLGNPEGGLQPLPRAGVTVTSDMVEMGRVATERLLKLGHRRIGFLYGTREPGMWGDCWLDGYQIAHHRAGLPIDRQLVDLFFDEPLPGQRTNPADWYLGLADPPTAYVVPGTSVFAPFRGWMAERGVTLAPSQVTLGGRRLDALHDGVGDWPLVAEDIDGMTAVALQQLRTAIDAGPLSPARVMVPYQLYNFQTEAKPG